jgi:hypothetical protein
VSLREFLLIDSKQRTHKGVQGWIAGTDIGNGITPWVKEHAPDAPRVSENESAISCLEILRTITLEGAGSFYSHDGGQMPW